MTFPIDTTIPAANNDPADDQPGMKDNFANINSYLQVDHTDPANPGAGQHAQVTFNANNVPATPTIPPILFTNTLNTNPGLFFYSGSAASGANQYSIPTGSSGTTGSFMTFGGMIVKFGRVTINNGNSSAAVTFPGGGFPNSTCGVWATPNFSGAGLSNNIDGATVTTPNTIFTLYRNGTSGNVEFYWLAIGY